jgi:hypothetical protein
MELVARRLNPHHLNLALLLVGEVCGVVQLGLRGDEYKLLHFQRKNTITVFRILQTRSVLHAILGFRWQIC